MCIYSHYKGILYLALEFVMTWLLKFFGLQMIRESIKKLLTKKQKKKGGLQKPLNLMVYHWPVRLARHSNIYI